MIRLSELIIKLERFKKDKGDMLVSFGYKIDYPPAIMHVEIGAYTDELHKPPEKAKEGNDNK